MTVAVVPNNKVFRKDELLSRYYMFSADANKPLTDRTIQKWRAEKGFPDPVCSRPRVVYLRKDVMDWEREQGWTFLEGHESEDTEASK